MAKARKWIINILILLISTVLTLYFVFRRRNFGEIIGLLKGAKPLPCAAALVLVIVFILSEAFIIRMLAGAAGSKAKIHHCFLYSFTGFFFSGITPSASGGQPMQAYFMKKDGIPVSVSAPVLAIVTVLYKGVLIITSLAVLIIRPAAIMKYLDPVMLWMWLGITLNVIFVIILISAIFVPGIVRSVLYFCIRIYKKLFKKKNADELLEKADSWIASYTGVTKCFRKKKKTIVLSFLITVFQRFALFLVTWLCCTAMSIERANILVVTFLQAMIASAVDMLPLPGGTGISESIFYTVFLPIVGDTSVIPVMVMSRGLSYYAQMLLGGIFTAVAFFTIGKGNRKGDINNKKDLAKL